MQTLDELAKELGLSAEQKSKIQSYIAQLAVELLESIKEDNIQNFDETITSLTSPSETEPTPKP
jgi:hypothetical protein